MKSKINAKSKLFFVFATFFLAVVSIGITSMQHHSGFQLIPGTIQESVVHSKINLNGNAQLSTFFVGNMSDGSAGNPYIMENFEINAGGTGSAIYIRNTNKHIIIQNCIVRGSGIMIFSAGIFLYNCTNVIIRWNTATQNGNALQATSSG